MYSGLREAGFQFIAGSPFSGRCALSAQGTEKLRISAVPVILAGAAVRVRSYTPTIPARGTRVQGPKSASCKRRRVWGFRAQAWALPAFAGERGSSSGRLAAVCGFWSMPRSGVRCCLAPAAARSSSSPHSSCPARSPPRRRGSPAVRRRHCGDVPLPVPRRPDAPRPRPRPRRGDGHEGRGAVGCIRWPIEQQAERHRPCRSSLFNCSGCLLGRSTALHLNGPAI